MTGNALMTDEIEVWRDDEWMSVPFGTLRKGDRFRHTASEAIPPHIILICEDDAVADRLHIFGYRVTCHREYG